MFQVMHVETDYTVWRLNGEVSTSAYETSCKHKWIQHRHSMLCITACHVGERAQCLVWIRVAYGAGVEPDLRSVSGF